MKTLLLNKEVEEDTRRLKDYPGLNTGRISVVIVSILPKVIYRHNTIPIKVINEFFKEIDNSKIHMKTHKRSRRVKAR